MPCEQNSTSTHGSTRAFPVEQYFTVESVPKWGEEGTDMAIMWACAMVAIAMIAGAGGYLIGRRQQPSPSSGENTVDQSLQQTLLADKHRLEAFAHSLYQLTSKVDVQVGEHTVRVGEIANSLETAADVESTLSAAQLLISTNLKLKTELDEAKAQIEQQREQMATCLQESRTDALTNVPNRRAFDLEINRSLNEWRQREKSFALLFLDIDHFKRVNDNHGHMVGDHVLKSVATCLKTNLRENDFLARFGGEEFAVILPEINEAVAILIAERLRTEVEHWTHRIGQHEISITTSIGMKVVHGLDCELDLLSKTDTALYAAKTAGRNSCYLWNNVSSTPELVQVPAKSVEVVEPVRTELSEVHLISTEQMATCA